LVAVILLVGLEGIAMRFTRMRECHQFASEDRSEITLSERWSWQRLLLAIAVVLFPDINENLRVLLDPNDTQSNLADYIRGQTKLTPLEMLAAAAPSAPPLTHSFKTNQEFDRNPSQWGIVCPSDCLSDCNKLLYDERYLGTLYTNSG